MGKVGEGEGGGRGRSGVGYGGWGGGGGCGGGGEIREMALFIKLRYSLSPTLLVSGTVPFASLLRPPPLTCPATTAATTTTRTTTSPLPLATHPARTETVAAAAEEGAACRHHHPLALLRGGAGVGAVAQIGRRRKGAWPGRRGRGRRTWNGWTWRSGTSVRGWDLTRGLWGPAVLIAACSRQSPGSCRRWPSGQRKQTFTK